MVKRVHFSQQKPLDYIPIKVGLRYRPETSLSTHPCPDCATKKNKASCQMCKGIGIVQLAPKTFTTRTKPLKGDYVVIGGSRMKPFIIEPRIEFTVGKVWEFNLRENKVRDIDTPNWVWWDTGILDRKVPLQKRYTFPELDIGIKGVSLDQYIRILLNLNKNVTLDTPFFINQLLPIGDEK